MREAAPGNSWRDVNVFDPVSDGRLLTSAKLHARGPRRSSEEFVLLAQMTELLPCLGPNICHVPAATFERLT